MDDEDYTQDEIILSMNNIMVLHQKIDPNHYPISTNIGRDLLSKCAIFCYLTHTKGLFYSLVSTIIEKRVLYNIYKYRRNNKTDILFNTIVAHIKSPYPGRGIVLFREYIHAFNTDQIDTICSESDVCEFLYHTNNVKNKRAT